MNLTQVRQYWMDNPLGCKQNMVLEYEAILETDRTSACQSYLNYNTKL